MDLGFNRLPLVAVLRMAMEEQGGHCSDGRETCLWPDQDGGGGSDE